MAKKTVVVTQEIEIEYDEARFSPEWMKNFREYMYPFQTVEDHLKHLAQLKARGFLECSDPWVEGYGHLPAMRITLKQIDQEEEVV
jgi:hypothetical protein